MIELIAELEEALNNLKKRQETIDNDPCWGFSEGSRLHKNNIVKELKYLKSVTDKTIKKIKGEQHNV